jgi:hypothetical protein
VRVDEDWVNNYNRRRAAKTVNASKKVNPIKPVYKSKWEANYAHQLELRRLAGDIKGWEYEPKADRILLCEWKWVGKRKSRRTYLPDFKITHNDGSIEMVEVKGYAREDAIVKYQWSVINNPKYSWRMVTFKKGRWIDLHYQKGINIDIRG